MSEHQYHERPEISRSKIVLFDKSRRRYHHQIELGNIVEEPETISLKVGTGTHAINLKDLVTLETIKLIPANVLNADGHKKGNPWTDFEKSIEGDGLTWLKEEEWLQCQQLSDAINDEELGLGNMIHGPRAEREKEIYFSYEGMGLRCKLDVLIQMPGGILEPPWDVEHKLILDLKTTQSIDDWMWLREVENRKLYLQDGFYTLGVQSITDQPVRFAFVLVEKGNPPRVRMRELDPDDRIAAQHNVISLLSQLNECQLNNDWSEPGEGIITTMPRLRSLKDFQ